MTNFRLLIGICVFALSAGAADVPARAMPAGFDLANPKVIEVRDSAGQVVMSGNFTKEDTDKDESEFEASLKGIGVNSKSKGKADVEIEKSNNGVSKQEIDLELDDLPASGTFKVFIDGKEFATVTADKDGDADLKFSSKTK